MVYCGVGGVGNLTDGTCINNTALTKDDFQSIVVDGMGTVGASIVEWLDLIVLLIVLGFIIGIFVKLGNLFR